MMPAMHASCALMLGHPDLASAGTEAEVTLLLGSAALTLWFFSASIIRTLPDNSLVLQGQTHGSGTDGG